MLSPKEEADWFGAESFESDDDNDWRDWGEGMTIPQMAKSLSKMSWDEVDEETGYGDDLFDWFDKWDKKSQKERETYALRVLKESYGAESFEAETTIAKQYGETLDNLDDLQKIVKKTISPKRKPTKFIKDAKSSVVDSWKQMGKDGFRRQMYEPIEFEAEIPKSVKLGFGFGAGLALFQVAVIGSAIGLGMLLNKE